METQEDRLRRMQRERGSMVIGPQGAGFPSLSWGSPPEPIPDTATVQVSWDEKPNPSGIASSTWSNNTPESLAAEITKPKPVYARTNKDGSPDYRVPKYGLPSSPVDDIDLTSRVRGGVDYVLGGDSIRNQLTYLDEVKSGKRGVDAPTSHHGLERPAPQVAAAEAVEQPKPAVAARPVALQEPEVPKPEVAAERPKMEQLDPKAAVQAEPVPMPAKPMMNPQQRMLAGRSQWRNIEEKNAALEPHYQEAARQLGLEGLDGDTFGALSPEVAGKLQRKAHSLHRQATAGQFNDRLSDRNQSREQNVPMALATAQRLQGRGRALLAQANGLADGDPKKDALKSQGEQMLAEGQEKHATFMNLWQQQRDAADRQQVMQAAMIYGKAGAGIVEQHLRGQADIQRQHLVNAGQVDQQRLANEGHLAVANVGAVADRDVAGLRVTAEQLASAQQRIDRKAELEAKLKADGEDRDLRRELDAINRTHDKDKQTVEMAQRERERKGREAQHPVPLTPPQQHAELWGPLQAADKGEDNDTPVQQHVDNFAQKLAGQEGLNDKQRAAQTAQADAWAKRHVMSRLEKGNHRPHDLDYLRSMVYGEGGVFKDKNTFIRELGSQYGGGNWNGMATKLSAFYDRLKAEEKSTFDPKLTQVGIPDNPVV